jgi:heme a synthase
VAATFLLIFVGGLVTNTGSALAVPDWPTTFGYNMFVYPWSKMVGGIFYEHSHRLIGSAVGMMTVALAVVLWRTEPRRWLRALGLVAVGAVVVQGVLGGLRVVLLQQPLAIVHGCFAQAFLVLMTSLAVCTSARWHMLVPAEQQPVHPSLRVLAWLTPLLVYVQIFLGALLTHTGRRLDAHVLFACLVTICVGVFAGRVLQQQSHRPELRRPALILLALLALQLSLGFGAYLQRFSLLGRLMSPAVALALPATHRITGALMLATSVMLALRTVRLIGLSAGRPPVHTLNRVGASLGETQSRGVAA